MGEVFEFAEDNTLLVEATMREHDGEYLDFEPPDKGRIGREDEKM